MQPYFFPYMGYFDLIHKVDRWVVFDTPQYIRQGWVNRNRILHPQAGWQYIVVPLKKHSQQTRINRIEIASPHDWRGKIVAQLTHYRRKAPFYDQTLQLVEHCLANTERSLSRLNVSILECVCRVLGIRFTYHYFSDMTLELGPIRGPGDWALQIAAALEASAYINPPGGADLFNPAEFETKGIKLIIQRFRSFTYDTGPYDFIADLSIIDALMWNSPDTIRAYLDQQRAGER